MNVQPCVVSLLLFHLWSWSPAAAQQRPTPYQPEDPELYCTFFRAHSALDQQFQAGTASPGTTMASTASLYHISLDDLPKLTTEVRKFMTGLVAWEAQVQAYVAKQRAAKQLPDMKVMIDFQVQRQRLVIATHSQVHQALTPVSWSGLGAYIKGDYRRSLATGGGK